MGKHAREEHPLERVDRMLRELTTQEPFPRDSRFARGGYIKPQPGPRVVSYTQCPVCDSHLETPLKVLYK